MSNRRKPQDQRAKRLTEYKRTGTCPDCRGDLKSLGTPEGEVFWMEHDSECRRVQEETR